MKIEKLGNKQNTEYRIECNVCGCKFRFKRSEVSSEMSNEENWFIKPNGHINCPQCNNKKYFYGSDLRSYQMTKFDKFITLIKDGFKTSITYMFRR